MRVDTAGLTLDVLAISRAKLSAWSLLKRVSVLLKLASDACNTADCYILRRLQGTNHVLLSREAIAS